MTRIAAMATRSKALWAVSLSLWLLTAGVGVHMFVLNLGAVHHDTYCQDH